MNQAGKVSKGLLVACLVVLIGGVLGVAGYWLGTRDNPKTNETTNSEVKTPESMNASGEPAATETAAETYCTSSGWTTYTNNLIGLEFCYPLTWGAPNLTAPQASSSVKGAGYEIAFSAYDTVVSSITSDYQNTIGRGGRCEDPVNVAPNFSEYRTNWQVENSDPEMAYADRNHIKSDDLYLISESVSTFGGSMCYEAKIIQSGTAYPVVKVALSRPLGSMSVADHVANPESLFSASERADFLSVVNSVRVP